MSGPKHLWSGDWESESRPAASAPPSVDPEPQPEAEPRNASRRWSRRQIAIAAYAGVAAAAVTVAVVSSLGGSSRPARHGTAVTRTAPAARGRNSGGKALTAPSQGSNAQLCQQNPSACGNGGSTPVVSGPSADWLGMQIVTTPAGAVISTVRLGSPADQAGLEPGDQIEQLNNHLISSVSQLRADTAGLRLGTPVTIDVLRSSVVVPAVPVPMTQRPTIHP